MNLINSLRDGHCLGSSKTRLITGGKITTFNLGHPVFDGGVQWCMFPECLCQNGVNFLRHLALQGKKILMTARVTLLLKSRASHDMLPFIICYKKTFNSAHKKTPLSKDIINFVLWHGEVGRAKDLLTFPRIYKTSNLVCLLCMIYLSGHENYTRRDEKWEFSGLVCISAGIYMYFKSRVANKLLNILQIWNFQEAD